jgi:hypothetical protein
MAKDIFVERERPGKYRAIQNKQVIATGKTQGGLASKVHKTNPDADVLLERVRNTSVGHRDKWRHGYKGTD